MEPEVAANLEAALQLVRLEVAARLVAVGRLVAEAHLAVVERLVEEHLLTRSLS